MTSYQELVTEQIHRFRLGEDIEKNPLEDGVFSLAKLWDEMPIWGLSFAEKPEAVILENTWILNITDEPTLITLKIPRQYSSVEVEREIVLDHRKEEALIERVYLHLKVEDEAKRELICITTMVKDQGMKPKPSWHKKKYLRRNVQRPGEGHFDSVDWVLGEEVRPWLDQKLPIRLPSLYFYWDV